MWAINNTRFFCMRIDNHSIEITDALIFAHHFSSCNFFSSVQFFSAFVGAMIVFCVLLPFTFHVSDWVSCPNNCARPMLIEALGLHRRHQHRDCVCVCYRANPFLRSVVKFHTHPACKCLPDDTLNFQLITTIFHIHLHLHFFHPHQT